MHMYIQTHILPSSAGWTQEGKVPTCTGGKCTRPWVVQKACRVCKPVLLWTSNLHLEDLTQLCCLSKSYSPGFCWLPSGSQESHQPVPPVWWLEEAAPDSAHTAPACWAAPGRSETNPAPDWAPAVGQDESARASALEGSAHAGNQF